MASSQSGLGGGGAGDHGSVNGAAAAGQQSMGQQPASRPFTLQEALPYSPQTSVIPFPSDLIPEPTIGSGLPASSIASLFNTGDFDHINSQASSNDSSSKQIKYAFEQLSHDLRPKERTFYKFKSITKPLLDPSAPADRDDSILKGVSPLTAMMLERAPTFIRQSTNDNSATPTPANGQNKPPSRQPSVVANKPSPQVANQASSNADAHRQNVKIEVRVPAKQVDRQAYVAIPDETLDAPENPSDKTPAASDAVAPKQENGDDTAQNALADVPPHPPPAPDVSKTSASSQQGGIAVELRPTVNKNEYLDVYVPDEPDEPTNLSKKRKRSQHHGSQEALGASLDQTQRADAALHDLERLSKEVFDSVGMVIQQQPGHSHIASLTAEGAPSLTAGCHQRLQAAIQKVIDLGSFHRVPLDILIRVQKLSDVGLKITQGLDYKVDEGWSESDVQSWIDQLPGIETGLKASRTTLRVMCGAREEKQLYSEETIQLSLDLFKGVMEGIVVPIVELRNNGSTSPLFKLLHPHKKVLAGILTNCQRLYVLMTDLIHKVQLSDMAIGTLEFTSANLIFVDSGYYEKDSVVGAQKFDAIRLAAMDMLCQVYLAKPDQRKGIFNDLLTSLEKLPVGKQSARQFRLSEGGSIQPLSALIMRLIQASSGKLPDAKQHGRAGDDDEDEEEDAPSAVAARSASTRSFTIKTEESGADQHSLAVEELESVVKPLSDDVQHNASYVVNFIVTRALKSTKSGDTPYRNLLDLFVEDFTTCMDSPDWPAAEMLLRQLSYYMLRLWEDGKSAAPAKNMALEVLGVMIASVSKLRSHIRKTADSREGSTSDELGRFLSELGVAALDQKNRAEHLIGWSGPYRASLEYLEERCGADPHLRSAISYMIADWANRTVQSYHAIQDDWEERDHEYGRLAFRLRSMLEDRTWLSTEYSFKSVLPAQAKFSYSIIVLRSPFCDLFGAMLNALLSAMASDQATVRSKALKSINQLLEIDPAILDGDSVVVRLILDCSNDSSPQVRDSAIGLMGKCISLRPNLEPQMTKKILDRFLDSGIGVRKRAMKLARDIYLRNFERETRSAIANGLLHRVQDPDESVRDLARQMIEEVWFAPFYRAEDTPAFQTSLADHVVLMIQTVKSGNVAGVLDKVLQTILSTHKQAQNGPFGVSCKLVEKMFQYIHDLDSTDPAIPAGRDALQVLQIFARADPKLFTFEEIRLLKPHLANISSTDDLTVFKAVTAIYRQILPQLSITHEHFLKEVRAQLQKHIPRLNKFILDDVVACLWIVAQILDARVTMAKLGASSLSGAIRFRQQKSADGDWTSKFVRYAEIVGMVGKHCDLDPLLDVFKQSFPKWQGNSVTKLMVDQLSPFADASQPAEVRMAALNAISWICQAHPRNYVSPNVYPKFEKVFEERDTALEGVVLKSFKEFLLTEERRSESAGGKDGGDGNKTRNLTVMGGTNYDDVASATTQRFLDPVKRIALSSLDEHAFLAVEVLASINRQGLVHPKQTFSLLITLETSPMPKISELAYIEHRLLHEKHETVIEREYAKAVQSAYNYQRDIVGDPRGATENPFQAKLHQVMEVLKVSKSKNRQSFFEKVVALVEFEPSKLNVASAMPPHVAFSRFVIENLAYFDYITVGEVLATVNKMEKMVSSTGFNLAQAIETEVFNVRMDEEQQQQQQQQQQSEPTQPISQSPVPTQPESEQPDPLVDPNPDAQLIAEQNSQPKPVVLDIDQARLRQLTSGAIILLCLWEARTFLRRFYSLGNDRRESKSKLSSKDLSKAPTKASNVTGDKCWQEIGNYMQSLFDQDSMLKTCRAFVELLNVDHELKVADDDESGDDPTAISDGEDGAPADGRGRKRKSSASGTPTRKKRALSNGKPRPRGRPRKYPRPEDVEAEADADGDLDFGDVDFF